MAFSDLSFERARELVAAFARERDWDQFHSPRNLLLAVMSEVGEAAEIVRWQGDTDPSIPEEQHEAWGHELADIAILLFRLADRSGVDLAAVFEEKLGLAGKKYPVEAFKGSNRKYSQ